MEIRREGGFMINTENAAQWIKDMVAAEEATDYDAWLRSIHKKLDSVDVKGLSIDDRRQYWSLSRGLGMAFEILGSGRKDQYHSFHWNVEDLDSQVSGFVGGES